MKKNFVYAMMSAIALTGAVSLTSCSSNEEVADVNPTFDGNSVRTDFAFNITKASQATTRMSAENVQETGAFAFRGINYMYLFPFSAVPSASSTTNISSADPYTAATNNNYSLGELTTSDITETNSKKVYSMTLPVGTNNFLFYGMATREATAQDFQVGRLSSTFLNASTANTAKSTSDINFNLVSIYSEDNLGTNATALAAYLTRIANATDWAGTVDIVKNHTGDNPDAYTSLADLYLKFTKIVSDRCGSAEAIKRTLEDLYNSASAINGQSSVTGVKTIASAICAAITNTGYSLRMSATALGTNPETYTLGWVGLANEDFPANLNLPLGAAQLLFDTDTKAFSYKTAANPTTATNLTDFAMRYTDICYPSEIVYFDNSPLRATNNYKTVDNYPFTKDNWDIQFQSPNASSSDWYSETVEASTRAVAMTNNVNYGVALLESTVKLAQDKLTDNMSKIVNGASNQTTIDGTGMKVTGILIGGQPATVGWNMVPASSESFTKVIYDKEVQYGNALSTTSDANKNFTVVLDNLKISGDAPAATQSNVNFALEIKNGVTDFYGAHGMIPANQTFYLVGTLDLTKIAYARPRTTVKISAADEIYRDISTYRITNESTDRVFVQDYKTIVNITLTKDALQKAYSCIPDLRSTELLFGLSVDLKWEKGATFYVDL